MDLKIAENIDRNTQLTRETFNALMHETFLVKSNPNYMSYTNDKSVEMNGQFVFENGMYSYNYSSLAGIVKYEKDDGTIVGEVIVEDNLAWWLPVLLGAECAALVATCHWNCRINCDGAPNVQNSTCYLCGAFQNCTCFPKESGEI